MTVILRYRFATLILCISGVWGWHSKGYRGNAVQEKASALFLSSVALHTADSGVVNSSQGI